MQDYLLGKILTDDVRYIIDCLRPHDTRLVGGIVRDFLLGKVNPDVDMATQATPDEVTTLLSQAGMKVIPTGIQHGTVTAIYHDKPYEITTLRKDIHTDGRHAEVEFTKSFEEDAKRRDFTFNALYMNRDGEIMDLTGGVADLQNKRLKFIGDAKQRIEEDHLRLLRYFRFFARLGLTSVPADLKETFLECKELLKNISWERMTDETKKILEHHDPRRAWLAMKDLGILDALGLFRPDIESLNNGITLFGKTSDALLKMAFIYHSKDSVYLSKDTRLTFSNAERSRLRLIFKAAKEPPHHRPVDHQCYIWGKDIYREALMLEACRTKSQETRDDCLRALKETEHYEEKIFPVQGKDLLEKGIKEGPQMGKLLKNLEEWWIDEGFPVKNKCIQKLNEWI